DYALRVTKTKKHGIKGTYFNIKTKPSHQHRNLNDIKKIINKSKLSSNVKNKSAAIFENLAKVEAKVHSIPINKVHFHEIGAVDTIIDIVGALVGLEYFGIKEIYCSPINVGSGKVKTAHGILPIPAPATAELLKNVPIYDSSIKRELTTPTGAAIIKTLAKSFGPLPRIRVSEIGSGAGSYDLAEQPNLLRIIIGEKEIQSERDTILQMEANIDDMNPKFYDKAIAAIMKAGALDAYLAPIRMKKQRNAVQLIVLSDLKDKDRLIDAIFSETTTFGIRIFMVEREKLKKGIVRTKYGRVKVGKLDGKIKTMAIEPDDYIKLKNKVPTPSPQPHPFWPIKK
ncbi:MAG: nickel pincer cofactor biosynthesis protein LarC, partial [Candidatus Margulisiibacteriota bacterium]